MPSFHCCAGAGGGVSRGAHGRGPRNFAARGVRWVGTYLEVIGHRRHFASVCSGCGASRSRKTRCGTW